MSPSLKTEVLAGRYLMEDRIAVGGMGEVWRAHDLVLGRPVAVKLLRPEYAEHNQTLERFRAEARHAALVTHPAIAQVYDYCETGAGQPPFLVMELVDGPALTQILAAGPLDPADVLTVVAQAADGLAAAHAAGLVHRDIKPGNLLIGPDQTVKITDFGIAHAAGSAPLTRTGTLIGTPAYLAPERVAGASATPASDIYSLGIVAYECLTGALPFAGSSIEIALAHQQQPLPPLPAGVPRPVVALVAAMTAKDPARRAGNAQEVAAHARQLLNQLTGKAYGTAPPLDEHRPTLAGLPTQTGHMPTEMLAGLGLEEPPPQRRRLGPVLLAVTTVLVVIALGGWYLASGSGPAPRHHHHPGLASSSRTVQVDSALIGQSAKQVARELRQQGLVVNVTYLPFQDHQFQQNLQPGSVLSIHPTGPVRVGSTVTLIAISKHHGFGDNGNGGDNGFGGGGNGGGGGGG